MWPFKDKNTQKEVSVVSLIVGLALIFIPQNNIPNSFMAGIILAAVGAIYLIDLKS
jgi:hypothetical protein